MAWAALQHRIGSESAVTAAAVACRRNIDVDGIYVSRVDARIRRGNYRDVALDTVVRLH
jgi:hypothetical protein